MLVAATLFALVAQETPLDYRRRVHLQTTDGDFDLKPNDPQYPGPNHPLDPPWHEYHYQEKVLAVFGLVDLGLAPTTRIEEANRILRYELLGEWPATQPSHILGQYAKD
jgi:hypothetical protein